MVHFDPLVKIVILLDNLFFYWFLRESTINCTCKNKMIRMDVISMHDFGLLILTAFTVLD
jgi:hypothetical protein